jgi:hypothetical protein
MAEAASSAEVGVAQVRGFGPQLPHQGMPSVGPSATRQLERVLHNLQHMTTELIHGCGGAFLGDDISSNF